MSTVTESVNAALSYVRENAPTMPSLYLQRVGLIVGFDPDSSLESSGIELDESFQEQVFEASRIVLNMEAFAFEDIKPYIKKSDEEGLGEK